jgi:hypothetical protein
VFRPGGRRTPPHRKRTKRRHDRDVVVAYSQVRYRFIGDRASDLRTLLRAATTSDLRPVTSGPNALD